MAEGSERVADRLAENAEVLENTRFVRSLSSQRKLPRPFSGINLEGAVLEGLDLSCDRTDPLEGLDWNIGSCAAFTDARLAGASLESSDLSGATFEIADLSGAKLDGTNLSHTLLLGTDMTDAELGTVNFAGAFVSADFAGATFRGTDLRGVDMAISDGLHQANFFNVCHDETTQWPWDFESIPPAPDRC